MLSLSWAVLVSPFVIVAVGPLIAAAEEAPGPPALELLRLCSADSMCLSAQVQKGLNGLSIDCFCLDPCQFVYRRIPHISLIQVLEAMMRDHVLLGIAICACISHFRCQLDFPEIIATHEATYLECVFSPLLMNIHNQTESISCFLTL